MDDRAHQPLAEIVAGVVILPGEVLLADVVEDVVDTRDHLLPGQGEGEAGIQNGEAGHHRLIPRIFAPAHFKPAVGQPPRRVKRIDFIRVVDHHIHTEHAHQPRRPFHVELPAAEQEGAAAIAGERISGDPDILRAGII